MTSPLQVASSEVPRQRLPHVSESFPSVSVVVPAWGRYVSGLPRALASCEGAAEKVVVCDPEDFPVARSAGATLVLDRAGRDLSSARNFGAASTSSEYVLFLDADDALLPGALARLRLAALDEGRPAAVGGRFRYADGSGRSWPPRRTARIAARGGVLGLGVMLGTNVLPATSTLVHRSVLPPEGLFPPGVHDEDWHAALHLLASGRYVMLGEDVLSYTIDPSSRSREVVAPEVELARREERDALLLEVVIRLHGRRRFWSLLHALRRRSRLPV